MVRATEADTIRILVATDNHVGYNERDPVRGEDSWTTFHEILTLAKDRDVDMVLLAGDLFHENKPSRKSMYNVMRSLRMNCLGDKPCALEVLNDTSKVFDGMFPHANYMDPNINVAIPVFSIHGNHDDPSGDGHIAALDLLSMSGLVNYHGKINDIDDIKVLPILLQKGRTKLALYGLSNVRDERLYRTFRNGNVKFLQPKVQKDDWFNLMSVHQNHVSHTSTSYLPEEFLPEFLDLVIWGHEHECEIDPRHNPEKDFHVIQPGSSVATSLMPGESVTKQITILSITGKEFQTEPIRLKTVRPFVMKDIILQDEPGMKNISKKQSNKDEVRDYLFNIVEGLITQAEEEWRAAREEDGDLDEATGEKMPKPLIRLRVDYSAPEGGHFDCENPQRFSNRFSTKVANTNDVIIYHRKKAPVARKAKVGTDDKDDEAVVQNDAKKVKVEKLVREFLTQQALTIFPQNSFGDAVSDYVDKDDKGAMENFVDESLNDQIAHLLSLNDAEDNLVDAMDEHRTKLEQVWAAGDAKRRRGPRLKEKPELWDSDNDGHWADEPAALVRDDVPDGQLDDGQMSETPSVTTTRGRGRGRGRGTARGGTTTSKRGAAAAKKSKRTVEEEDDDEDGDIVMPDDDEEEKVASTTQKRAKAANTKTPAPKRAATQTKKAAPTKSTASSSSARQTTINFSQPSRQTRTSNGSAKAVPISDDEISDDDDDDAFEPVSTSTRAKARK